MAHTKRIPFLDARPPWTAETTLDVYQGIFVGLLGAAGNDARAYSPRRFCGTSSSIEHSLTGTERAKSIVVAVRSFIRFLGAAGRCPAGMEHAIPGFDSWRLASVPPFLATEDVEG